MPVPPGSALSQRLETACAERDCGACARTDYNAAVALFTRRTSPGAVTGALTARNTSSTCKREGSADARCRPTRSPSTASPPHFLEPPNTARWMLAQFVSPKAPPAAAGVARSLCARCCAGIASGRSRRVYRAAGLCGADPAVVAPLLRRATPPPARGFLLCTIFAWAAALGINYVDFHDDFDEPTAAALVVGVLLALFKATNNFFVPTVGLHARRRPDPRPRGHSPRSNSSRRRGSPATRSCTPSRTARRAAGGGRARRSRTRFKADSPPPPTPATTCCAPHSRDSTRAATASCSRATTSMRWKAATGEQMSDDDADAMVRSIDADGNGEIDVDEFIALPPREHVYAHKTRRCTILRSTASRPTGKRRERLTLRPDASRSSASRL